MTSSPQLRQRPTHWQPHHDHPGRQGGGDGHIGHLLGQALKNRDNQAVLDEIAAEVKQIATSHPMFSSEWVSPCIREQFEDMYCHPSFQ